MFHVPFMKNPVLKYDKSNKHRVFNVLLYPDSESYNYNALLDALKAEFPNYAYCTHDSDYDENGTIKKAHTHFVGKLINPRSARSICKSVGLPENFIEVAPDFKSSVRYLIHADNEEKCQYDVSDIVTNTSLEQYFRSFEDSLSIFSRLLSFIEDNEITSFKAFAKHCIASGYLPELRQNVALWGRIIDETREIKARRQLENYENSR